jgi:hypothetical protein
LHLSVAWLLAVAHRLRRIQAGNLGTPGC